MQSHLLCHTTWIIILFSLTANKLYAIVWLWGALIAGIQKILVHAEETKSAFGLFLDQESAWVFVTGIVALPVALCVMLGRKNEDS